MKKRARISDEFNRCFRKTHYTLDRCSCSAVEITLSKAAHENHRPLKKTFGIRRISLHAIVTRI